MTAALVAFLVAAFVPVLAFLVLWNFFRSLAGKS